MTPEQWLEAASRFTIEVPASARDHLARGITAVHIERIASLTGNRWAVRSYADCLNRDGWWEHEPSPSARDEAFVARCRFATKEEALAAVQAAYKAD